LADATFTGRINTQGQKAMAASTPVVIASDQSALPVTGTFFQATQPISAVSLPLPTGAATDRTTAAGPFSVRLSDGAAFYDATKTGQLPAALVGGRLDANIGAWLGSTLPTVGQKVMASSLPVTIASDQAAFPVSQSGTWTVQQGTPPWTIDLTRVAGVILTGDNSANFAAKLPILPARANAAVPAWTEGFQVPLSVDLTGRARIYGGLDHDLANDLQTVQVAGNASPVDVPPAAVSAVGDRVRSWLDRYGANVVRRRKIRETYTVVYRLAEAAARLDQTFTHVANTNKQWATLHHTAGATKEVRLQLCIAWITSAITVAPQGIIELRQITSAPATGNPAITPTPRRRGGTAAESVALYLPTTAGTEANVNSPLGHHVFDEAVSVATTAFQHPQGFGRGGIILFDASQEDDEAMQPVLPIATLDGWAVVTRLTGATVMRMTVLMVITEEVP
ncbi:MAG TPA: hypothetical protein VGS01_09455, partial [Candidatus Limnocylindria bacterium]|nr:hypothetical protein [Candidatus Limnocylindria bacterium]